MFRDSIGRYYIVSFPFSYNKNGLQKFKYIKIYENGHRVEYIDYK
jgi:hypothetical protein